MIFYTLRGYDGQNTISKFYSPFFFGVANVMTTFTIPIFFGDVLPWRLRKLPTELMGGILYLGTEIYARCERIISRTQ